MVSPTIALLVADLLDLAEEGLLDPSWHEFKVPATPQHCTLFQEMATFLCKQHTLSLSDDGTHLFFPTSGLMQYCASVLRATAREQAPGDTPSHEIVVGYHMGDDDDGAAQWATDMCVRLPRSQALQVIVTLAQQLEHAHTDSVEIYLAGTLRQSQ